MLGLRHANVLFALWLPLLTLTGCATGRLSRVTAAQPAVGRLEGGTDANQAAEPTESPRGVTSREPESDTVPCNLGDCDASSIGTDAPEAAPAGSGAWGVVGLRGYASDQQVAPNGLNFTALFTIDANFNYWLCQSLGVYLFSDAAFWGQRAAPGITNPTQGRFDFSKREFDFSAGLAWNYFGPLEARAFAYSFNNLNRGVSPDQPTGYADGVGLENRCYLCATYADLGTATFDVGRASFLSAGFFPTKDMVDADGNRFKPGPFIRAYLTLDVWGPRCYLFADTQLIATRSFVPELLRADLGVAARPWSKAPRWELRLGSGNVYDPQSGELETNLYGQVRYQF